MDNKKKRRRQIGIIGAVVVVVIVGGFLFFRSRANQTAVTESAQETVTAVIGDLSASATASAARWLVVSLPPVSMMMSEYFGSSRSVSVRTAGPGSLMLVYPAPLLIRSFRSAVKSVLVSWSSASTKSTSAPARLRMTARLVATVDLPLPPLMPPTVSIIVIPP